LRSFLAATTEIALITLLIIKGWIIFFNLF
jgi:hypothetical protein